MNILAIYAILVALLALLGLIIIFNFVRYQFKGDKTLLFLVLFSTSFVLDIVLTLVLVATINNSNV